LGGTGKILIIGGGPAGLGAAWRLHEAGHTDWELFEKVSHVGGLAASFVDGHGFTWDLGGHVVFSHYDYFDRLLDSLLEQQWVEHERQAWIWMRERFIPYPLQNNIRHLPAPELLECLEGLLAVQSPSAYCPNCGLRMAEGVPSLLVRHPPLGPDADRTTSGERRVTIDESRAAPPATFADWIVRRFGAGLARVFLDPYNRKVWATDPAEMSAAWVGERVATVDLKRVLRNVIEGRDDVGWGPNATFRFPLRGGTGRIWQALAGRLPAERLHLGAEVVAVDGTQKIVHLQDGRTLPYDWLITTMPLDILLHRMAGGQLLTLDKFVKCQELTPNTPRPLPGAAAPLRYSSTHVIGVGLAGPVPEALATKCWIYFPEPELPFYRVTVFSNYSPHNVPHPGRQWSLLAEVSESATAPVEATQVVGQAIEGLKRARLLGPQATIESVWHRRVEHGYPTPSLQRDAWLDRIEPALYGRNILSRGRFGAWKYEVGNMDHSFMQGVEAAHHILTGEPETTLGLAALGNARTAPG